MLVASGATGGSFTSAVVRERGPYETPSRRDDKTIAQRFIAGRWCGQEIKSAVGTNEQSLSRPSGTHSFERPGTPGLSGPPSPKVGDAMIVGKSRSWLIERRCSA